MKAKNKIVLKRRSIHVLFQIASVIALLFFRFLNNTKIWYNDTFKSYPLRYSAIRQALRLNNYTKAASRKHRVWFPIYSPHSSVSVNKPYRFVTLLKIGPVNFRWKFSMEFFSQLPEQRMTVRSLCFFFLQKFNKLVLL